MRFPVPSLIPALAVLLLASCGMRTMPTSEDMDRYYAKAEQMAQDRIERLEGQRDRGEITQAQFDEKARAARARIPEQATALAWARHENLEARKRAFGMPTGDHPVQAPVPGPDGLGESFYRRAGESGGENFYSDTPNGTTLLGGPNRGERPEPPPLQVPGARPEPEPDEESGT